MRAAYDAVAEPYAELFNHELAGKPLDRSLLAWFAEIVRGDGRVRDAGRVADLGTGPGQVARALFERGVDTLGVDLSERMISVARRLHPDRRLEFRVGDFLALDLPDASLAGATAFYAHVHLPRERLGAAFAELARVLRPGAPALLAFQVGDETVRVEEYLDRKVELDWHFFPMAAVVDALVEAGLSPEMRLERSPYPQEHPTVRGYVLARRRAAGE